MTRVALIYIFTNLFNVWLIGGSWFLISLHLTCNMLYLYVKMYMEKTRPYTHTSRVKCSFLNNLFRLLCLFFDSTPSFKEW